ncbi:Uncharacterised protein [Yersinia frederiksenii]|nr:Uncharacterised protein [Yersinia frederiksenii]
MSCDGVNDIALVLNENHKHLTILIKYIDRQFTLLETILLNGGYAVDILLTQTDFYHQPAVYKGSTVGNLIAVISVM